MRPALPLRGRMSMRPYEDASTIVGVAKASRTRWAEKTSGRLPDDLAIMKDRLPAQNRPRDAPAKGPAAIRTEPVPVEEIVFREHIVLIQRNQRDISI